MAQFETWLEADLQKPVTVKQIAGNVFSADSQSNVIRVRVTDGGANATLSGTVTGYIVRDDGATVIVTGTLSGNVVSIVLPTSAYTVVGPISIAIRLTTGEIKTVLAACTGYVYRTSTDTIVDPGHVIPSIEELLAQIAACEAATAAANTAASNANTKAGLADTAASNANTKAGLADTAAGTANTAASRANSAAAAVENMTATATGLAAGASPTVTVTIADGHYVVAFGIPKGDKGDKGNKGDTGDNASIASEATAYQNSTNGTTIPTGTWLETQPTTPQGQFLWTRKTITWNNNQTTVMYGVNYMGLDGTGTGTVQSVMGVQPNVTGDVETLPSMTGASALTAGSVGLVPAPSAGETNRFLRADGTWTAPAGSGGSQVGIYSIDATIPVSSWSGSGPYTVTISDNTITSTMKVLEWYLTNETEETPLMLGDTTPTVASGALTLSTTVIPTAQWSVHIDLGEDGSDVLEEVAGKADQSTLAIVETGDTASQNIASGKYVCWKGQLYTASTAISQGTTFSSSNLTAVSGGGLNQLSAQIANIDTQMSTKQNAYSFSAGSSGGTFSVAKGAASLTFIMCMYRASSTDARDGFMIVKVYNSVAYVVTQTGATVVTSVSYNSTNSTLDITVSAYATIIVL